MKCNAFINREKELKILEEAWRKRPILIIVYGRRRTGKTRLIREFLRKHKHVYYLAQQASHEYNLNKLALRMSEYLGKKYFAEARYHGIDVLLKAFVDSGGDDTVVVIDEFTYWVRSAPLVLGELQRYVDTELPSTRIMLVLMGSLIGTMETHVLGYRSPLYGRSRYRLRINAFRYPQLKYFVPRYNSINRVIVYSLFGGLPYYLCMIDDSEDLYHNIRKLMLEPGAPMLLEKELILREELRDPHVYNAILSSIAKGYNRPSLIADATGIDKSHVSKYLSVLTSLGIVKREVPLFSKRGYYRIVDPILRTWFSLLEPISELIDLELVDEALEYIGKKIPAHVAGVWEDLVREYLLTRYAVQGYSKAGKLVHKGEEIDVVVLNEDNREAVLGEAKWSTLPVKDIERIRRKLLEKASRLLPRGYTVREAFIAVKEVKDSIRKPDWILTPADLEKAYQPIL